MSKLSAVREMASSSIFRFKKLLSYFLYNYGVRGTIPEKYTDKTVLFDVEGLTINRRLAQLVLQFSEIGYCCLAKVSLKDFLSTSKGDYSEIVFKKTRPLKRNKYGILVCGKNNRDFSCKRIVFNDDIIDFPKHVNDPFFYPLIFHPIKIINDSEEYISKIFDKNEKNNKIGIVFIGSTNYDSYNTFKYIVNNEYGMPTRLEVLDHIIENFKDRIFRPNTREDFDLMYNDPRKPLMDKIVIIDKIRISGKEYFDILLNSEYHLWTCGDAFPYCHNQIEGMACGTIPICQPFKGKLLYKGLENGVNCLVFNALNDLDLIVPKVLDGNDHNNAMAESVRKVFLQNFSNDAFKTKIIEFVNSDKDEEKYYIHPRIYK